MTATLTRDERLPDPILLTSSAASIAPDYAIEVRHLRREFSARRGLLRRSPARTVTAVDDVSFAVPRGTIFGLLGPNGAGKTTTIKMLSTLLVPTAGSALVNGFDVLHQEQEVRRQLGVVLGGDRGLYWKLSARDNLVYFAHLYGMQRDEIEPRCNHLLDLVQLRDRAGDRVEGFSRGMKQRLHLAKALLHNPPVLFLDEPTIGLDPASAVDMRRAIAELVPHHTVLLTTHDMHEADQLCADIAIVDHGRIVAEGTPGALKARVADQRRIVLSTRTPLNGVTDALRHRLRPMGVDTLLLQHTDGGGSDITIYCTDAARTLDAALDVVRSHDVPLSSVRVIEPTLEDAFLSIAGGRLT